MGMVYMKSSTYRFLILIVLCTVLSSCYAMTAPQSKTSAGGNRHACNFCHSHERPTITKAELTVDDDEIGTLCIKCHDYRNNHHPYDFTPTQSKYVNADMPLPLFSRKIQCLTCHDPHPNQDFSESPKLLRGGPYADRREICFKCHYKDAFAAITPHQMVDEKGAIMMIDDKPACLFCHTVMPDPKKDRTRDVRFRADVGFICWRCHPPMPGMFFTQHFLQKPKRKTMESIRKFEKDFQIIFPIAPRNRVTCSTCHNPHQAGVIVSPPAQKGAGAPMRLRLPPKDICQACHTAK